MQSKWNIDLLIWADIKFSKQAFWTPHLPWLFPLGPYDILVVDVHWTRMGCKLCWYLWSLKSPLVKMRWHERFCVLCGAESRHSTLYQSERTSDWPIIVRRSRQMCHVDLTFSESFQSICQVLHVRACSEDISLSILPF